MSVELKIKAKHLALEPAIIRKEENKLRKQYAWLKQKHQIVNLDIWSIFTHHPEIYKVHAKWSSLNNHRRYDVRNASRATHLARAYIMGVPYSKVETKRKDEQLFKHIIRPEVFRMIAKYGVKKLSKTWNREKKTMMYVEAEEKALNEAIDKWLET